VTLLLRYKISALNSADIKRNIIDRFKDYICDATVAVVDPEEIRYIIFQLSFCN
jgi:hypothetical protein